MMRENSESTPSTANIPSLQPIGRSLPRPLRLFLWVFLIYSALTWISCLVHYRHGDGKPYSSPFIHESRDPFTDLRTYRVRFDRYFHHPEFFEQFPQGNLPYFSYPAPAATLYRLFYRTHHPTIVYLLIAISWAGLLGCGLFRVLRRIGASRWASVGLVTVMLAGAFPFDFMLERGNLELVVWILVFVGLFLYVRGREYPAAVVLGIAASLKIFPVIFCGILLHRRRYSALCVSLMTAGLCDGLSLWYAGPTLRAAFRGFNRTVTNYQQSYSVPARAADVGMDHSFFAFAKVVGQHLGLAYQTWLLPYYLLAGAMTLLLFVGRSLRLPLANQVLFVTLMAIGLPPNSFDYTLVYLYAGWAILCVAGFEAERTGTPIPMLPVLLVCFVPLLAPFSLFVAHGVRFGGQVQTISLFALLAFCLAVPIPDALWSRARISTASGGDESVVPLPVQAA